MKKLSYALAVAMVLTLCSCTFPASQAKNQSQPSSTSISNSRMVSPDGLVEQDISRWTLPTDPYNSYPSYLDQYAFELSLSECMLERGHHFTPIRPDLDPAPHPGFNDAGRRLFNTEIAAKYGYHFAPDPDGYSQSLRERDIQDLEHGEDWQEALISCTDQLRDNPPIPQHEPAVNTGALSGANDPKVLEAAKTWRECMNPLGIVDLPESPEDMPGDSLAERFGLREIDPLNGQDAIPGAVSDEEIRIATADAQCHESSGYLQAYYDAEWENDYEFVADNLNELQAIRKADLEQMEQVRAYIASHPLSS